MHNHYFARISECQTDTSCCIVESLSQETYHLPAMLERPEFSVKSILEENDKLTRFYHHMIVLLHW